MGTGALDTGGDLVDGMVDAAEVMGPTGAPGTGTLELLDEAGVIGAGSMDSDIPQVQKYCVQTLSCQLR